VKILDNIPGSLDTNQVLNKMNMRKKNDNMKRDIQELLEVILPIARPKVCYMVCYIDKKGEDFIDIGQVRFTSRLLRDNLDKVERIFPYIATCGREADAIKAPSQEFVKAFYLDQIKEMVLELAIQYLEDHLTTRYRLGQISDMEPGSLESWPIDQQKQLFSLFGNVEGLIGVKLSERCLMTPLKSASGIYFPTEVKFESCQLCSRKRCGSRRAPYKPELARKYGDQQPQPKI
jgi:hypothetical protein